MRRPSWLDTLLERFQHNWETKAQFRAMISGVAGIVVIALLCAAMGMAASFAGAIGNTLGGASTASSFVQSVTGANTPTPITFPVKLATPWPSPQAPGSSPLGPSQTPQPTATFAPTPTLAPTPTNVPCTSNCGGGGGPTDNISISISPTTFKNGTQITVYVTTTIPNEGFNAFVTWPDGATSPTNIGQESGNSGSVGIGAIPGGCPGGKLSVWVKTQNNQTGVTSVFSC